jgi:hypothetical protein
MFLLTIVINPVIVHVFLTVDEPVINRAITPVLPIPRVHRATASGNGWGLWNGYYSLSASVGGDSDRLAGGFADGRLFSDTVDAHEDGCQDGDGAASASVSGFDAQGRPHHRDNNASF